MAFMKHLEGQNLVFEGDLQYNKADLKEHAVKFGAQVSNSVSEKVTNCIIPNLTYASRNVTRYRERGMGTEAQELWYEKVGRPVGTWLFREDSRLDIENVNRCVVMDVETTGLDPDKCRIISIALWKGNLKEDVKNTGLFRRAEILGGTKFSGVYNPGVRISREITRINGFSNQIVSHKQPIREELLEIINFIEDLDIVAHNVDFDMGFLNAELTRNGFPELINRQFCTLKRMRAIAGRGNANLDQSIKYFGLPRRKKRVHDAMEDVCLTTLLASEIRHRVCKKRR